MKKSLFSGFLATLLTLGCFIGLISFPTAQADINPHFWIYNTHLNGNSWTALNAPLVNGYDYGFIIAGNNSYLTSLAYYLKNTTSTATGTIQAAVFSGGNLTVSTYVSPINNAAPDMLSTNTFNFADQNLGTGTYVTFNFEEGYFLRNDTYYGFCLKFLTTPTAGISMATFANNVGFTFHDNNADGTFTYATSGTGYVFQIRTYNDQIKPTPPAISPAVTYDLASVTTAPTSYNGLINIGKLYVGVPNVAGNDNYLYKVSFYLKTAYTYNTGSIKACVFAPANTTSTKPVDNSKPDVYSDNSYDLTGLTSSYAWVDFYFRGNYFLNSSSVYSFALYQEGATGVAFQFGLCNNSPYSRWFTSSPGGTFSAQTQQYYMNMKIQTTPYYEGRPTATPHLSYTISPAPNSYMLYSWATSAFITQSVNYTLTASVTNNSLPVSGGTYSVYKTTLHNAHTGGLITDLEEDVLYEHWTLNSTGTYVDGAFMLSIYQDYYQDSVITYQAMKINGTINGSSETFECIIGLLASEPDLMFEVKIKGGYSPWGSWKSIASAPTVIPLWQGDSYTLKGYTWINSINQGEGNITIYTTALSNSQSIFSSLPYANNATTSLVNGTFTFALSPRSSSATLVYQAMKIDVVTNEGKNYTLTYFLSFTQIGTSLGQGTTPTASTNSGGILDENQINQQMQQVINLLILFLFIGAPAFLLGVKAGLPGLIVGAVLGLAMGVLAGLIPFWFLFIVGAGVVAAFFMWRRNNGQ